MFTVRSMLTFIIENFQPLENFFAKKKKEAKAYGFSGFTSQDHRIQIHHRISAVPIVKIAELK